MWLLLPKPTQEVTNDMKFPDTLGARGPLYIFINSYLEVAFCTIWETFDLILFSIQYLVVPDLRFHIALYLIKMGLILKIAHSSNARFLFFSIQENIPHNK